MMWRQQVVVINVASDRGDLLFRTRVQHTRPQCSYHGSLYCAEHQYGSYIASPPRAVNKQMIRRRDPCRNARRRSRADQICDRATLATSYGRSYDTSDEISSQRRRHTAVTGTLNHRPCSSTQTISLAVSTIYIGLRPQMLL